MAGYIDDIDTASPVGGDDPGDFPAEMRDFKGKIKDSFPNISAPATATEAQLNYLSGVTPGTSAASKALVLDASSNLTSGNMNNMSLGGLTAAGTVQGGYITDGTATISGGTASSLSLDTTCAAVTQTAGDNTTKPATTAFVANALNSVTGIVQQIVVASHHTNIALNAEPSYTDIETVTLANVQSGNNVLLFALTNIRGASTGGEYYIDLTDNSNTSVMPAATPWRDNVVTALYRSSPIMANVSSPGTGSVTFKLRGAEQSGAASLEVESAVMVAIEYTP